MWAWASPAAGAAGKRLTSNDTTAAKVKRERNSLMRAPPQIRSPGILVPGQAWYELGGPADAPPPTNSARRRTRVSSRKLRHRPRPAARARNLACRPGNGSAERLDRRRGESRAQSGDADRGLGSTVGAKYRAADADHAFGRLLEVDGVAPSSDSGELALEPRDGRDRVLRPRHELPGAVEAIDLVVGDEREHRLAKRSAVGRQTAADVGDHVGLAEAAARVLALDVHDVAVIEYRHLRGEPGATRELAHRGPPDFAHGELVEVRVAELRDAEVQTPAVPLGSRRDETFVFEDFEQIGHTRTRRTEQMRKLTRCQSILPSLDEEHEQIERPSGGASDGAAFPHGA